MKASDIKLDRLILHLEILNHLAQQSSTSSEKRRLKVLFNKLLHHSNNGLYTWSCNLHIQLSKFNIRPRHDIRTAVLEQDVDRWLQNSTEWSKSRMHIDQHLAELVKVIEFELIEIEQTLHEMQNMLRALWT